MNTTPKTTPPFCHEWQRVSISSRHLISTGRASIVILINIRSTTITIIDLMTTCCLAIRLKRVFTWHNSSLRVSRRASMRTSCAMMSSRVTLLIKEKEVDVDGAIEVGGIAILDHLERSYTSLRLMVAASMAHMTWKWLETRKVTEKWRRILVIAEGKMSLSRVTVSLYTSMRERIKWEGKSIVRCSKKERKNRARGSVMEL